MKKFLALMLALTMLVGLTAIGASAEGGKTTVVFWNSCTGATGYGTDSRIINKKSL